jgi:pimeloyl-ACP methyl ester carboxylesterase
VVLSGLAAGVALAGSVARGTYSEFVPFQPDRSTRALERRYTNEASAFLDVGDARIHYRDEGPRDAPTLVALHGTASSLHTWDGWVESLTDEFRVVRLDMPGFGLTGPPESAHTLEGLVGTVGALCDELGLQDVVVTGNSLGGGVAWRLSVERPDLVSRLVLVDPGGATLLSHIERHYRTLGTDLLTRYATPRMAVRMILRDAYGDPTAVTEEVVTRYYDLLLRSGNRRAVTELAGNYREDHFPDEQPIPETDGPVLPSTCDPSPSVLDGYDISEVTVPTLFQWGSEDTWLPESFGHALASRVENSQFVSYDGVGHVPMEEAPEASAADAAAFLSEP